MNRQEIAEAQQIFNKVSRHLLTQGETSVDEDGECLYRGPGGLRCAVGCLIADEHYTEDMEGNSVNDIRLRTALKASGIDVICHYSLLRALQILHDRWSPSGWRQELRLVALEFGLSPDVLKEFGNE